MCIGALAGKEVPWHLFQEGKTGTSSSEHLSEVSLIHYTPLVGVIICTVSKINNLKYFFPLIFFFDLFGCIYRCV